MSDFKSFITRKKRAVYRILYDRIPPKFFYKSPKTMASLWYAFHEGRLPNLRHPKNFSELMMSINLKAMKDPLARSLRIRCADKYAVRGYVKEKGLEHILNECYGVYDSFDEINFDALPNQFVLKLTSCCGMNFICRDKSTLDVDQLRETAAKWFAACEDFGLKTAEWHYVEIKPRLIVEKYLSMLGESLSLIDYKWHCFNGQVYHIQTISERDVKKGSCAFNNDTYNTLWQRTECIKPEYHVNRRLLPKPVCFDEMKRVAETLSKDFEYVRVDLYEIDGKVLFGELTFTPAGCYEFDYKPEYLEDICRFYYDTKNS